jgi:hypothetical protein
MLPVRRNIQTNGALEIAADPGAISEPSKREEALELPAGWKKLAGLEAGLPATRDTILAQLPVLLGQATLEREVAHRAVHAVMIGLAAGRWGKQGAPIQSLTTDRVLKAVADVDRVLMNLEQVDPHRVDPAFAASFERFRLLATRALDHAGPSGLWGPTSIYGPIENHPMSPSSLYGNFQQFLPGGVLPAIAEATKPEHADPLKRTGEHHHHFLPGNALASVGPVSALNWFLGAAGNNGSTNFTRFAEGGAWKDAFGEVVEKNGRPLYELYGEAYAAEHASKDAFFGVEGSAKKGDDDTYRFESKETQWISVGCSQVTPGHRFAATLYRVERGNREEIDRSEGIFGPAGIHTKVPPGKYEVVVEQLAFDPDRPELREHSVGKRLGPALQTLRKNFGKIYPDQVDQRAERDPDRYRLFVSGSGKVDDRAFGPPERDAIRAALQSSAIQERALEQSVQAMEATLGWLDAFTPFAFLVPPRKGDRSSANGTEDPMIERFMRSVDRLGAAFYRSAELPVFAATWIRFGMEMLNTNLRAFGLPPIGPQTVANHADR